MIDLEAAKARIIQKLQATDEEWIIRSIQKLLDIEEEENADEADFWHTASGNRLERAYNQEEPDYDSMEVKEPNPEYKP